MRTFVEARAYLLTHRLDYWTAVKGFQWPEPRPFNWALDWFDAVLGREVKYRDRAALWIADTAAGDDATVSFRELSLRSNRVANYLHHLGVRRGDRVLVVLGNVLPLWETMLAAMKIGAIVIPATTLLAAEELADRIDRGAASFVVADESQLSKFATISMEGVTAVVVGGDGQPGWHSFEDAVDSSDVFEVEGPTAPDDPMLLYFTSGTTKKPKLVRHSQRSYTVGALSTMYWLGLLPGDIHLNISSPGWAKHAWSSLFAPWNAGATVFILNQPRFDPKVLLSTLQRYPITTLCAPPTVWRLLIQENLRNYEVSLREVCSAGEPLNPEIIDRVRGAWGLTVRDGYGQTETTAQIGNSPGQVVKAGAMGRPLPGYDICVLDADGNEAREGEVCIRLEPVKPAGLMQGYEAEHGALSGLDGPAYHTGDVAFIDDEGYLTFVGRADDVFKSSDYRISPFELESVLLEHPAVAEAAVVPSPDPIRLSVPKAYLLLTSGTEPCRETAISIFRYSRERLAPFKRLRLIEFVSELPKTISGKIRRAQLRRWELDGGTGGSALRVIFSEVEVAEDDSRHGPN